MRFKPVYFLGYSISRMLSWLFFQPRISGRENIPREGGFMMASNHISYYDPPLVAAWQSREMYFLAKRELFRNPIFGGAISHTNALPVSRGAVDRQAIRMAVEAMNSGFGLVFFPEGTRSKTDNFLPAKAGVGMVAVRAGCPIVPTYIHGANKLKDCFWRRDRLSITYGEMIPAEWVQAQTPDREGYQIIADTVMERIAQLRSEVTGVKPDGQSVDKN